MASTIPFNSFYRGLIITRTTRTWILSAMHVSKFRAPFRSKLIFICVCDMLEDQMGIQIKEQRES